MSIQWNWSWMKTREETSKASNSVDQSGGTIYTYRTAVRGILETAELQNSIDSFSSNINHQWRLWRSHIQPILDSLPSGSRDERWRTGTGLPEKIDALNFGIQGSTLFVFNDADTVKASGRYWDVTDERPKTIAEAFEDLWNGINDLEVGTSGSTTSVDLEDLWLAVGHHYRDVSLTSAPTSLDARVNQIESNQNQLSEDLYGVSEGYAYDFGVPLSYSVAQNIEYILQLHNVVGWQSDPSTVSHSGIPAAPHTHPYTEVSPMPSSSLTQARVGPYTTLNNDILRLRYEIQQTRGSANWYSDSIDPVDSAAASLLKHISYVGSDPQTSTNPHGIDYTDTGTDTLLTNLARYVGMTDYTSAIETPTYSSIFYVTQGANLETAIGELDAAMNTLLGTTVIRVDYSYDRSSISETARMETPITITHNMNRKPIVEVFDITPEEMNYWGQYTSPATEVEIVHVDNDSFQIWTPTAIIEVVAIY